jgi:hypothetical protein
MKYLCLAYEEERVLNGLSCGGWDMLRKETLSYIEDLRKRKVLITAEPLKSVQTASTVRVRNEKLEVTDGPFAETKETLGGFFLIDTRDLDDAISIKSKWPSARFGSIEIRPLEDDLREGGR